MKYIAVADAVGSVLCHDITRIVPGECKEIVLNGDHTVEAALELAGFEADGHVIQVNGHAADLDTDLSNGDFVSLTKQIKGNC